MTRKLYLPILALDLGTYMGWAMRDRFGVITSGVQSFDLGRWESHGMRLLRFRKWLREMLDEHLCAGGPAEALVVYERPVVPGSGGRGVKQGAKKQVKMKGNEVGKLLAGVLLVELEERGLHNAGPTQGEIKKAATGKGNSNKAAMADAAVAAYEHYELPEGFDPKVGDDEADALCTLTWGINESLNSGPAGYNA